MSYSSNGGKQPAPNGGHGGPTIRTLSDINRGPSGFPGAGGGGGNDNEPQQCYTGGEKSGMLAEDPSKGNDVDAIFGQGMQRGASQELPPSFEDHPSISWSFRGTGRLLTGETIPLSALGQPVRILHQINLWNNGFSVDDGPLRSYDDPANADFIESLKMSQCPQELERADRSMPNHVSVINKLEDYRVTPAGGMLAEDPSKGNDVDAIFGQGMQRGASQELPPSFEDHPSISWSFRGTGRLLTGETIPLSALGQPVRILHQINLWNNGFSVDDGPLRSYDDPANADFIESLKMSQCPQELERADRSMPNHVSVINKLEDYRVTPAGGMLAEDPSKGNDVDAIFGQGMQRGASQELPPSFEDHPSISWSFRGTGRLLTGETIPLSALGQPVRILHQINLWNNGFSVDDGPLRSYDDPANADFIESLKMSQCPQELERADRSMPNHVSVINKLEDYRVTPAGGMLAEDPSKGNDVDAIFGQGMQRGASQELPPSFEDHPSISWSFRGTGRLLTGETIPLSALGQPVRILHQINLWNNGFSVDDGPLRSYDDPANADFIESLKMSQCPQELERADRSMPNHVSVINKLEDYRVTPAGGMLVEDPSKGNDVDAIFGQESSGSFSFTDEELENFLFNWVNKGIHNLPVVDIYLHKPEELGSNSYFLVKLQEASNGWKRKIKYNRSVPQDGRWKKSRKLESASLKLANKVLYHYYRGKRGSKTDIKMREYVLIDGPQDHVLCHVMWNGCSAPERDEISNGVVQLNGVEQTGAPKSYMDDENEAHAVERRETCLKSLEELVSKGALPLPRLKEISSYDPLAAIECLGKKYNEILENNTCLKRRWSDVWAENRLLNNDLIDLKGKIRIFCRPRPFGNHERCSGCISIVKVDPLKQNEVQIVHDKYSKVFKYDYVFRPDDNQETVFAEVLPVVKSAMNGFNVCIFAYGQSGTGKTFTMEGVQGNRGINYRTLEALYKVSEESSLSYNFSLSILEINKDGLKDLICSDPSKKLQIREVEGRNEICNLTEIHMQSSNEMIAKMEHAFTNRTVGRTKINDQSSRSHCMVKVRIVSKHSETFQRKESNLWLVDLAGSEQTSKSGVEGMSLKETAFINKSLSSVSDVISALVSDAPHIPYRNSDLTRILQNSLGGNCKTIMFVNISSSSANLSETRRSLDFADKVRGFQPVRTLRKNLAPTFLSPPLKRKKTKELESARNEHIKSATAKPPCYPRRPPDT
ncbi:hypothetical protein BS78_10G269100 [Paspalum vaginatum]|nr:hypothetical protein BS78_10G269100 [Paspalum vaginatum]KAJ1260926.1 hypothetical protein BS78_10G269100 [Paspalum vaginatum]